MDFYTSFFSSGQISLYQVSLAYQVMYEYIWNDFIFMIFSKNVFIFAIRTYFFHDWVNPNGLFFPFESWGNALRKEEIVNKMLNKSSIT